MSRAAWTAWAGLVALSVILAACRPTIAHTDAANPTAGGAPTRPPNLAGIAASDLPADTTAPSQGPATPEPSLEEIATAVPAQALKPDSQVNVDARLFHGLEATDAPLLYAQALNHFPSVNLVADFTPPIAGYDIFAVDAAPDAVPVWIGTAADAAAAAASGLQLQAVGELSGRDSTVLVTRKKGGAKSVSALKGKVLYDNPQAAAALRAAGLPASVKLVPPDDPGAPFDPSSLLDGTVSAAAVSEYEGWARIQEAAATAGLDGAFVATPLHPADHPVLGELIWAQPSDLAQPQLRAAVTAFLGVVAQSQVECRDNLDDCASTAGAQSDRTPDGIAWSIDQMDASLWPTTDGILHIDPTEWDATVAMLNAARVPGVTALSYTNDLVDVTLKALTSLDIHGPTFKPEGRKLFP